MRILVLLKSGAHYVADNMHDVQYGNPFVSFDLATGGEVSVPLGNIEAVEKYVDREIEVFRRRLAEVEARAHGAEVFEALGRSG